ncbi:hypothetical protein CHS0354_034298 [Potamilus streckersoni]|uniref:Fas-associated death domain protein n=1 Tax=Potamilus streckersoni TaxID=2493646 RepID=A0AAE0WB66_9BIVA|nr:hypothetical protein CHS0354_034298 [Potamilus streckersoni]
MGDYKAMLIELASKIHPENLKSMLFALKEVIKKRESEKIKTAIDLWDALEDRDRLGPNNLEFLKELLRLCMDGRTDGLRIVEDYEVKRDQRPPLPFIELPNSQSPHLIYRQQPLPQPQIVYVSYPAQPVSETAQRTQNVQQKYTGQDLSKEINFLTRNLGRNWRFFMRALGVDDTVIEHVEGQYRSVRDQIYYCMQEWIQDQKQGATKDRIIKALRDSSVERNDLAADLEQGHYK